MEVFKTPIEGLLVIEPKVFRDARGFFVETYNEKRYREAGVDATFVQDNQSCSSYGVVRGLHFQRPPYTQAKLVCCTEGRVLDIAVDLRKDSPTYGQYFAVELDAESHRQFFIPRGFAHGFQVLSKEAIFIYKVDNKYAPQSEQTLAYDDPAIGIDWPISHKEELILSEKDMKHALRLDEIETFE